MDKERLEDIKEDVENNCKKEYEFVTTILYEDAKLLISTVEEQQKEIERLDKAFGIENELHIKADEVAERLDVEKRTLKGDIMNLSVEINRLREALEFYADEKTWYYGLNSDALEDCGDNAKQALEESK